MGTKRARATVEDSAPPPEPLADNDHGFREPLPAPEIGSLVLYNMAEAAPHLRSGESTLRRLVGQGDIPRQYVTRIGGKLFMTGDQIMRYIEFAGRETVEPDHGDRGRHARRPRKAAAAAEAA